MCALFYCLHPMPSFYCESGWACFRLTCFYVFRCDVLSRCRGAWQSPDWWALTHESAGFARRNGVEISTPSGSRIRGLPANERARPGRLNLVVGLWRAAQWERKWSFLAPGCRVDVSTGGPVPLLGSRLPFVGRRGTASGKLRSPKSKGDTHRCGVVLSPLCADMVPCGRRPDAVRKRGPRRVTGGAGVCWAMVRTHRGRNPRPESQENRLSDMPRPPEGLASVRYSYWRRCRQAGRAAGKPGRPMLRPAGAWLPAGPFAGPVLAVYRWLSFRRVISIFPCSCLISLYRPR